MRQAFEQILKYFRVGYYARKSRRLFYYALDLLGYMITYIFRCFRLFYSADKLEKNDIKKILIIRIDRIGDLILSTPAIRAVRETFPDAEIHLFVKEYTKELVVDNPNIDKLVIYKKDKLKNDYDLAIAFHPGLGQNFYTFKSGARIRVGYTGWGGGFFLTHKIEDDRAKRIRHEVESALEVVGLVGCNTVNKDLDISITEEGERLCEEFLRDKNLSPQDNIIIIHPGARQEYIRWKKEGYAAVADILIESESTKVVLLEGHGEEELVRDVLDLMKQKPIVASDLSLTGLISLIKRCSLFIGNSTGTMHIAAALNISVVAIFGNIHPLDSYQEWGPWGEGNIVVSKNIRCADCHPGDCLDFKCMNLINPEDVLEASRKIRNY